MLTETQTETLRAAVDRIIPADDYPGGWELGVGDFLARLLTREPELLFTYRQGLDALDAEAQAAAGTAFAALGAEAQDALLHHADAGEGRAAGFFPLLIQQAMEGYYADPGNGGNKNGIAWDMIGFKVTG